MHKNVYLEIKSLSVCALALSILLW